MANSRHYPSICLLRLKRATNASVMTLTLRSMCFHGQCTDVMTEFVYNYYVRLHILRHKCKQKSFRFLILKSALTVRFHNGHQHDVE